VGTTALSRNLETRGGQSKSLWPVALRPNDAGEQIFSRASAKRRFSPLRSRAPNSVALAFREKPSDRGEIREHTSNHQPPGRRPPEVNGLFQGTRLLTRPAVHRRYWRTHRRQRHDFHSNSRSSYLPSILVFSTSMSVLAASSFALAWASAAISRSAARAFAVGRMVQIKTTL